MSWAFQSGYGDAAGRSKSTGTHTPGSRLGGFDVDPFKKFLFPALESDFWGVYSLRTVAKAIHKTTEKRNIP